MAREAKFDFQEERRLVNGLRLKNHSGHSATVSGKHGYISFSAGYIRDKNLNGAFIKFFGDIQKKAVGWRILKREGSLDQMVGYRQLKVYESVDKINGYVTRVCKLNIKRLLTSIGAKERSYLQLPIGTYNSKTILDETMDYIQLD